MKKRRNVIKGKTAFVHEYKCLHKLMIVTKMRAVAHIGLYVSKKKRRKVERGNGYEEVIASFMYVLIRKG